MSGLLLNAQNVANATQVYGKKIALVGDNIANINNKAYARKEVQINSGIVYNGLYGPSSAGITLDLVEHARNPYLDKQILDQVMNSYALSTQQIYGKRLESYFSSDINNLTVNDRDNLVGGFAKVITDFFTSFSKLSAKSSDSLIKSGVIKTSEELVTQFNQWDSRLTSINSDIASQLDADVQIANGILANIAKHNERIVNLEIGSGGQLALEDRDKRQAELEDLAEYINFTVIDSPDVSGSIDIIVKDDASADVNLITTLKVTNTLAYDSDTNRITTADSVDINVTGGGLSGLMSFKSGALSSLMTEMDNLAQQFVTSVNLAYAPSGNDYFDSTGTTAETIALDSALTSLTLIADVEQITDPSSSENALAKAIEQLGSNEFSTGSGDSIDGTYYKYYSVSETSAALSIQDLNRDLENEEAQLNAFSATREEFGSVSLDEEIANLLALQKVYLALTKYLKITSDLLDLVVSRI